MNNIFEGIPAPKVKKAKFDLSHDVKFTGDMGKLIPVLCQDVLPGEHFKGQSTFMVRFAPLLAPIMHLVYATVHFFYVPNRILWPNDDAWENIIYGGKDGNLTPAMPYLHSQDLAQGLVFQGEPEFKRLLGNGSLWDYMGLPPFQYNADPGVFIDQTEFSALPFYAYQKIWNEFYRDETLQPEVPINVALTPNKSDDFIAFGTIQNKCWKKDQFTSALPWPQRGDEVLIPTEMDVEYKNVSEVYDSNDFPSQLDGTVETRAAFPGKLYIPGGLGHIQGRIENIESVSNANITINDLRVAITVQRWLEANARGGYRENEATLSHFGVVVPDYRLRHPEYIGGGSQLVQVSEVLATATSEDAETNTIPQGNMAGHGIAVGNANSFSYKCPEHGWIIGILSVMPKAAYQQGVPKKFLRKDRFDFAWPQFVGLGEQEILSKEIYYDPTDTTEENDALFGYQQRYWEYKYESDRVAGDFRDQLSFWHCGRIFEDRPLLNASFLTGAPTKRIFAVEDENVHSLWMVIHHRISALRPLPYYSVPGLSKI